MPTNGLKVTITRSAAPPGAPTPRLAVRADFNAAFVADLKATVPAALRSWSPEEEVWLVSEEACPALVRLARRHYTGAVLVDARTHDRINLHTGEVHHQASLPI